MGKREVSSSKDLALPLFITGSPFLSSVPLRERLVYRLRWVTLGYHYDWDSKTYHPAHHTPFPSDLAALSQLLAAASGWEGFRAEAGIVNYYHMDSTLSPHTDHSERDITAPLVSIRLVQCVSEYESGLQ